MHPTRPPLRREIITLPLAPGVRSQLLGSGFRAVDDLQQVSASELARLAEITEADAQEVLEVAGATPLPGLMVAPVSARRLLETQRGAKRITTFCKELDQLLGGGVVCGQVTEFCGVPGVGKTQLGIQLAVDVQIPAAFAGAAGAAVYIDTEGSFMVDRVLELSQAAVRHVAHCAKSAARKNPADADALNTQTAQFNLDRVLSSIHTFRVHDQAQQLACLHVLKDFLPQHPEVRLVVIDSVTFHFRQDLKDMAARARVLTSMAQTCMQLAEQFNVAVVFMNQVTTRITSGDAVSQLVPALGESWGQAASTRVVLHWQGEDRYAYLYKSPSQPSGSAPYVVTQDGVRGISRAVKRPTPG